jgi:hypothetical protein
VSIRYTFCYALKRVLVHVHLPLLNPRATEERERRTAAQRLARAARRNCGSRDAARAKFQALRTLMADLFQTYAEQEYARGQASPTALQHSSASEAFSLAPSLTAVLSGDFEHTSVARDKKLKRLCGGVWKAARSQSNPEAAARDLVAKCLLCVDGANEWPPTAPPPLPPPPNMRFALQPPDLQGINGAELTGLKGTVGSIGFLLFSHVVVRLSFDSPLFRIRLNIHLTYTYTLLLASHESLEPPP